jgi:hypothetical protein
MKNSAAAFVLALLWLVAPGRAFAVEGKWTPDQILEHDAKWLREQGLELEPEDGYVTESGRAAAELQARKRQKP